MNVFIVRNLFAVKAAESIEREFFYNEKSEYIVDAFDEKYYMLLVNSRESKGLIKPIKKIKKGLFELFTKVNYFSKYKAEILSDTSITRLFVTYPLHLEQSIYVMIAKQKGIQVNFFEEGTCFYKINNAVKYNRYTFKYILKILARKLLGLEFAYNAKPDKWYSVLPCEYRGAINYGLKYRNISLPKIKAIFLSRPLTSDFLVPLTIHIQAIKKFVSTLDKKISVLHIKFHPRESAADKSVIIFEVGQVIKVEVLDVEVSAETIVFNLLCGTILCGFETATLVYAKGINGDIAINSVLPLVMNHDKSGVLNEFHEEYRRKYKYINFIYDSPVV